EIARTVGYMPRSILCVPLRYGDTIIGVLEVLDKEGRDSFTPDDIEILAYFAELAAQATDHVRRRDDLRDVLVEVIAAWGSAEPAGRGRDNLMAAIDRALGRTRSAPEYQKALEIAGA